MYDVYFSVGIASIAELLQNSRWESLHYYSLALSRCHNLCMWCAFFFSSAKWQSRSTEKQIQSIKIYILVPALELSLIRHLLRKNKNRTLKDADKFLQFKNRRRHKTKTRLITYTRRFIYVFCCYLITQPVGALFLDFFFRVPVLSLWIYRFYCAAHSCMTFLCCFKRPLGAVTRYGRGRRGLMSAVLRAEGVWL